MEPKITKDMVIAEILENNIEKTEEINEVLSNFGIHCVGCGASGFETLEEGVLGHGFNKEELKFLLDELNKVVSK